MIMEQTYQGYIANVNNDEVTVVYDCDGDLVEHLYYKSQFTNGISPSVGTHVELTVQIKEVDRRISTSNDIQRIGRALRPVMDEF